mmetsp:Transcript_95571/g.172457  ORF Transcript_95571/g.172457 Transcript_95571/m.172457 type:complete len:121 (+) Transcript_95571:2-364(+)
MGFRLSLGTREKLQQKIEQLSDGKIGLDFSAILLFLQWAVDSNFGNINAAAAKVAEAHKQAGKLEDSMKGQRPGLVRQKSGSCDGSDFGDDLSASADNNAAANPFAHMQNTNIRSRRTSI